MMRLRTLLKLSSSFVSFRSMATDTGCPRVVKFFTSYNGLSRVSYDKLMAGIICSGSLEKFLWYFQKYSDVICDVHISCLFNILSDMNISLTQDFWEGLYPYAKALVKDATRDSIEPMTITLIGLAKLLIQDNDLWATAERKYLKDNMLRYVKFSTLPSLLHAYSNNKKGSEELIETIEKVIVNNIGFYMGSTNRKIPDALKDAYDNLERKIPKEIQEVLDEKYYPPVPLPNL